MPKYASTESIRSEVAALHSHGARHFRVGRQPDLLAYGAGPGEYPAPEPEKLDALFSAIRTAAPDLRTLHIDNTNPATIARHEEAAREALRVIIRPPYPRGMWRRSAWRRRTRPLSPQTTSRHSLMKSSGLSVS